MQTNEDKIIDLFQSGNYQLAYSLRNSLNIDMNYGRIDLAKLVLDFSDSTTLYIPSNNGAEFRIEIYHRTDEPILQWIDFKHSEKNVIHRMIYTMSKEFGINEDNSIRELGGAYRGNAWFHSLFQDPNKIFKVIKFIFEC